MLELGNWHMLAPCGPILPAIIHRACACAAPLAVQTAGGVQPAAGHKEAGGGGGSGARAPCLRGTLPSPTTQLPRPHAGLTKPERGGGACCHNCPDTPNNPLLEAGAQTQLCPTRAPQELADSLKGLEATVALALSKAQKDNNAIYLEKVPPFAELPRVQVGGRLGPGLRRGSARCLGVSRCLGWLHSSPTGQRRLCPIDAHTWSEASAAPLPGRIMRVG